MISKVAPEVFAAVCAVKSVKTADDESWTGQGSSKHRDD